MHKAKRVKNDEFFTRLSDIENEMRHYKDHFKDKVIYLNCDNPKRSEFWQYFNLNFEFLGLKKLITSHYNLETGEGDFRSPKCIELLKEADIVVTNPPFSLFREFIAQLTKYNKKFLIIGNMNAIAYKEVFPLIKDDNLWLGVTGFNRGMYFQVPEDFIYSDLYKFKREQEGVKVSRIPGVCWFTNLNHSKRNEELILYKTYNEEDHPQYENYDAINVDKVKDIPIDYYGIIGVPITFLDKYNPEQFEIIDINPHFFSVIEQGLPKPSQLKMRDRNDPYARILIRKR